MFSTFPAASCLSNGRHPLNFTRDGNPHSATFALESARGRRALYARSEREHCARRAYNRHVAARWTRTNFPTL